MRKCSISGAVMVFVMVTLISPSLAETVTLRFANETPETSWSATQAVVPWAKQVEQATHGKVKIQIFHMQTLTKSKDAWNAAKNGIADIAYCFHGYWPGMTPLTDVISLPALPFKTAEKGSEAFWQLYEKEPVIQRELSGNKILLLYTSSPYLLATSGKQVKTLEDVRGMKIRMTGGPPTDMVKALGGIPMLISMPDNYLSLQKGVIDGMGAPWEAIHGYRLYDVVNYVTEVPFPAVYFSIAMNQQKWDSLDKDIQKAIMKVSGLNGSKFWGRNWFDTAKQAAVEKAKESGKSLELYELPANERNRWLEIGGKPIWNQWVKKMEAAGRPEAQKILGSLLELLSH